MYTELLKLCGFEPDEIKRERPRVDRAFAKLGLDEEDFRRGEWRLKEYLDIELLGLRKFLGIWMRELVNLVLAREEHDKIVYSDFPMELRPLMSMMLSTDEKEVYFGVPGQIINMTMGQIFDKITPYIEVGEESGMPPGAAHCALYQTRLGAMVKGVIPFPDLSVIASYHCDQPAEAEELLHEVYGVPVAYLDSCSDPNWGDWPKFNDSRVRYCSSQASRMFRMFEEIIGCQMTEEAIRTANRSNAIFRLTFQALIELIGHADPQPISQASLAHAFFLNSMPTRDIEGKQQALEILAEEVKQRVERGEGILEKGAPGVFCTATISVDPSITRMIERTGLAIRIQIPNWLSPWVLTKHPYREWSDMIGVGPCLDIPHSCEAHCLINLENCKAFNVDGAINFYPYSCREWVPTVIITKRMIEKELGIPVLVLEGDCYDTRNYSAGQLRTRVETFAELVKAHKAAKAA
ncbi:MAG TPA: 2-hydroxyacyl-CoA dehydratase [Dehalococcoidia bacterium]|nr:2-hydroxyacyl-CoA dehydratase [Dehalococcoidia bacterium]